MIFRLKSFSSDATVLGFQLVCVLVHAFAPSAEFTTFVASFLQRNTDEKADGIGVMAKCELYLWGFETKALRDSHLDCLGKLDSLATKNGRGKMLTVGEIEHASVSCLSLNHLPRSSWIL